jgi:predicted transcriptional regulator
MQEKGKLMKTKEKLIHAIDAWWKAKDYAPSMRELARLMNKPVSTIHYHLRNLRDEGLIEFEDGVSRSVKTINMLVVWKEEEDDPNSI